MMKLTACDAVIQGRSILNFSTTRVKCECVQIFKVRLIRAIYWQCRLPESLEGSQYGLGVLLIPQTLSDHISRRPLVCRIHAKTVMPHTLLLLVLSPLTLSKASGIIESCGTQVRPHRSLNRSTSYHSRLELYSPTS